jgi:hypothetical protein
MLSVDDCPVQECADRLQIWAETRVPLPNMLCERRLLSLNDEQPVAGPVIVCPLTCELMDYHTLGGMCMAKPEAALNQIDDVWLIYSDKAVSRQIVSVVLGPQLF